MSAIRWNFRAVQQHVGTNVTVCAVVKADAYGHGALQCSKALEQEGAQWLGVTSLDEAIPLREAGVKARILLMTGFWRGEEAEIIRLGLTPTIWEPGQIEALEAEAVRLGVDRFAIHLKIDSGMGRLGVAPAELPKIHSSLRSSSRLALEECVDALRGVGNRWRMEVDEQTTSSVFDEALKHLRSGGIASAPGSRCKYRSNGFRDRRPGTRWCVLAWRACMVYHLPLERARVKPRRARNWIFEPVLSAGRLVFFRFRNVASKSGPRIWQHLCHPRAVDG